MLSLKRMNRVRDIDTVNGTIIVEAGCVLHDVQQAANNAGRLFPLSLAAEGTATIGGNLSTNAGGTQVLRYGNARELALGLEVVLPSGEMWNGLRGLRKDNTGYDLRDLFIGAEGTLGVITAACLKTFPLPRAQLLRVYLRSSGRTRTCIAGTGATVTGPTLTAFELIPPSSLELVTRHFANNARRLSRLIRICVSAAERPQDEQHAGSLLQALAEQALEKGLISDAASHSQHRKAAHCGSCASRSPEAQVREGNISTTFRCRSRRSRALSTKPTPYSLSDSLASNGDVLGIWATATCTTIDATGRYG